MEGKDPTEKELAELERIGKAMEKLNAKILKMGYSVYLSAHGRANIMKGPTHDDRYSPNALYENVVHSFILKQWDGGDW